jgi:hypothetical protein
VEKQPLYRVFTTDANHDTMEQGTRVLATRNLDELEQELMLLERRLTPLLNHIRAMQGKPPLTVQKG